MRIKTNISVVAMLYYGEDLLLLKRNNPPMVWGPPSGRVHQGEKIEAALIREVMEETGLNCEILMPVSVWEGKHDGEDIISITFVCSAVSNKITLSDEHSDFMWVNISEISFLEEETDVNMKDWPNLLKVAKTYLNSK
ncbi:MAG: NUDIX hydrolase [Ruminococcus flavefaciens]|nr:NUDIX hydrolase [Ruminococcus flavefaciens]